MQFIQALVHSPVKVSVGALMVTLFGLIAFDLMPMQLTPEVQTPTISVTTRWPGASPQEVEREIVIEQEEQLKGVEGLMKMRSESSSSSGTITLEFQVGTNMDEALLKVNSRLQQVPSYPEDADQPVITTANSADRPIAWFILGQRYPSDEEFDAFEREHPELKEALVAPRRAINPGVGMLRLRQLAEQHPEVNELLPPDGIEVSKMRRFAEDEIEARFERVPGVSQSNVVGGLEDELQVIVDPEKLAIRQVTLDDVARVLRGQNVDISAGDFWEGKRRWVVRALGQFRSPEQVGQQLLATREGRPVFVSDVAKVQLGYKKPDGLVRRFGESSIAVNCVRETGANVLDVMAGLQEAAEQINRDLLEPQGLELLQVYDETQYIKSSMSLVQQNIFVGGALTMTVLMLFLHLGFRTLLFVPPILVAAVASVFVSPWLFVVAILLILISGFWFARGSLVVGIAIPTSIVGTFLVLGILNRSLNVISLAGLAFAVGMLVDNAVVVLENIYRHSAMGRRPFEAAVKGAQEVWGAVVASTLTTVAVFLPVVFIQEEAGQLFRDIALAVSAAVSLSLLVSITLIPTAAARLIQDPEHELDLRDGENHGRKGASRLAGILRGVGQGLIDGLVKLNRWIQQGWFRRVGVVAGIIGLTALMTWLLWPKVEYLPSGNRNLVFGILLPPPGYNLNELMSMGETVEEGLRPYWDVDPGTPEAAELESPIISDFFFVARGRSVFMGLRSHDPTRAGELVPLIQRVAGQLPGTFAVAKQSSLFEQGLTAGRTIEVEITGPDLNRLVALGGQVLGKSSQLLEGAQVRPVPSLDLSSPEIHVRPRLLPAADMQISSASLGFGANALVDGAYVGDYYLDGKKIDLTVIGEKRFVENSQDIESLPVATPDGKLVPLKALVDIQLASGPEQINHREKVRAITIEVSPPPNIALEDAMDRIESEVVRPLVESGQLKGGYQINLAGTADKLKGTWQALRFNLFLALLITYLLMAALFESWLYPLVIIFSVPLGAVGGLLGLQVLNLWVLQPLDVLTMLGFVILIGTVVNNPILIVHQSLNHMREDQASPRDAILMSVRSRVRPIFMTTMTTVLGLLPLVLFPGSGSELYRGLGSVILGGLLVSTLVTLVLVPTLFSLAIDLKSMVVRALRRLRPSRPNSDRPTGLTAEVPQIDPRESVESKQPVVQS
jgi:HAE1 family hydrophobic/amphiphilic exporter-1